MKHPATNNTQSREATPSHLIILQGAVATALCRRAANGRRACASTQRDGYSRLLFFAGLMVGMLTLTAASPTERQPNAITVTPTLGNYPNTSLPLSADTLVTPDVAPTNAASMNVSASTSFKGKLEGNPVTGVVRVTDAHPAGTYTVTVRAFDAGGLNVTRTFMLTVTTPLTCNPLTFAAAAPLPANSGGAVAVGDFNGDGKQDAAVVSGSANTVSILLGNGAGSFGAPTSFGTGTNTNPASVAVGDFNGDGKQDLATANFDSSNVSILLGDGAGNFGARHQLRRWRSSEGRRRG